MNFLKSNIIFFLWCFSIHALADVAVIVHPSNNNTISDNDISRLFLGKLKAYANGDSAAPANLKFGNSTRKEFEQKVLKKSASQVKAYWSKRVFSGKGKPPKEFSSDKDVLAFVSSEGKGIGYIDAANVDDSVKVIKVF